VSADTLIAKLDGVQGRGPRWRAICPAHQSKHRTRSLAVFEADDGRVLVKCHAGCDVQAIVSAVGLELSDLFPPRVDDDKRAPKVRKPWSAREVAQALEAEAMVAWVFLQDIANGKVLGKSDRARAKDCAERCVHLMQELANAA
jgi:hypothetical protein